MIAPEILALPDCAERLGVASDAASEIEALAGLLQFAADARPVVNDLHLAVRGVMMRMKGLAGIVMAALGDEADPLSELRYRLLDVRDDEGGAA